jgi:hypothetical protein
MRKVVGEKKNSLLTQAYSIPQHTNFDIGTDFLPEPDIHTNLSDKYCH